MPGTLIQAGGSEGRKEARRGTAMGSISCVKTWTAAF